MKPEVNRGILTNKKAFHILCFYVAGYVISLVNTGIPTPLYWVPVKMMALAFAITAGNASYFALVEKLSMMEAGLRTIKYVLVALLLLLMSAMVKTILLPCGIDITPILGIR